MKMRKSTWLLLVLALVAIFLVAGCEPTTPTPTPPENGEEPTPPPADKECPEVVSTKVTKTGADSFRVVITFDETINSSCIETITNWVVDVTNPGRVGEPVVTITGVEVDGKVVTVNATVVEVGEEGEPTVEYDFAPFTRKFTTLDDAIEAANLLLEAVDAMDISGASISGASPWAIFLAALEAAEEAAEAAPEEALTDALNALASALEANNINAIVAALNGLIDALDEDAFDALDFGALAGALGALQGALAGFGGGTIVPTDFPYAGAFGEIDWVTIDALFVALSTALGDADYAGAVAALGDLADALADLTNSQKLALETALKWEEEPDVADVAGAVDAVVTALEDLVEQVQDLAEDFIDAALAALNEAFTGLGVVAVQEEIPGAEAPEFAGLICNKADAERYAETFGLDEDDVPTFADEVSWELSDCAVYDELGNVCCEFEGKDCCVEPYCEECPEEGCDLTEPGACL